METYTQYHKSNRSSKGFDDLVLFLGFFSFLAASFCFFG